MGRLPAPALAGAGGRQRAGGGQGFLTTSATRMGAEAPTINP